MDIVQGGVVSTSPNPQAGGPPLVGCPRLLIQFIRSYLHIGGRSSIRNLKTRHAVVTGTHYTWPEMPEYGSKTSTVKVV